MFTFKTTIQNGRLLLDEPVDLPEGTGVEVYVNPLVPGSSSLRGMTEEEQGTTPEAIARWMAHMESLDPPSMTDEEWEADQERRREYREWQRANAVAREQRLQRGFE